MARKTNIVLTTLLGVGAMALVAAGASTGAASAYAMIIGFSALALAVVALVLRSILKALRRSPLGDGDKKTDDQQQPQEQLKGVEAMSSEDGHSGRGATFGLVGSGDLLGGANHVGEFYNRATGEMDSVKQPGGLYGDSVLGHMHDDD